MKRLLLIAFIGLLAWAGWKFHSVVNDPGREKFVHPNIEQYLCEWEELMTLNGVDYESAFDRLDLVTFVESEDYCGISSYQDRMIGINRECFECGPYSAKALLWHELGHYIFQLGHERNVIMSPYKLDEDYLRDNWQYLENTYIKKCKQ